MNEELRKIAEEIAKLSQRLTNLAEAMESQPLPGQVRTAPTDAEYVTFLQSHPQWPNISLTQIQKMVKSADPTGKCGKPRAIRLRNKAKEQTK